MAESSLTSPTTSILEELHKEKGNSFDLINLVFRELFLSAFMHRYPGTLDKYNSLENSLFT